MTFRFFVCLDKESLFLQLIKLFEQSGWVYLGDKLPEIGNNGPLILFTDSCSVSAEYKNENVFCVGCRCKSGSFVIPGDISNYDMSNCDTSSYDTSSYDTLRNDSAGSNSAGSDSVRLESAWFDCAQVLLESPDFSDVSWLERCILRYFQQPVVIGETSELLIRESTKEDYEELSALRMDDPAAFESSFSKDTGNFRDFCSYLKNVFSLYDVGPYSIFLKSSGEFIGQCELSYNFSGSEACDETEDPSKIKIYNDAEVFLKSEYDDEVEHSLMLGYMIKPNFRNQGWCTKACRLLLQYVRDNLDFEYVYLTIDANNASSIAVAKKLKGKEIQISRNRTGNPKLMVFRI